MTPRAAAPCPGCGDPTPRHLLFAWLGTWLCAGCIIEAVLFVMELRDAALTG